jgi:hypothetical protein
MRRSCGKKESKITFSNVLKLFYNFPTEKRRFFTIFQPKNGVFLQFSNQKTANFYNFPTEKRRFFTIFQPKNGAFLQFSNNFDDWK